VEKKLPALNSNVDLRLGKVIYNELVTASLRNKKLVNMEVIEA
jgi:hypothetical protein